MHPLTHLWSAHCVLTRHSARSSKYKMSNTHRCTSHYRRLLGEMDMEIILTKYNVPHGAFNILKKKKRQEKHLKHYWAQNKSSINFRCLLVTKSFDR